MLILRRNYSCDQQRQKYTRKQGDKEYSTFTNLQLTSFEAMKCKLRNIMNLTKQYLTDETLENMIIDEYETDKKFSLKYPSIKFTNNEMYLCQIDNKEEYSSSDSDSTLSQSESESSDSLSSNSSKDQSINKKDKIPENEYDEVEKKKKGKKQKDKSRQQSKNSIKQKDLKRKTKNKLSYDTKTIDEDFYKEQQIRMAQNILKDKIIGVFSNQGLTKDLSQQSQTQLTSQHLTMVSEYNTEQMQSNQNQHDLENQIQDDQINQTEFQNKRGIHFRNNQSIHSRKNQSLHSRNNPSISIPEQGNDDQSKIMGLLGFADNNQDNLFDKESLQIYNQNVNKSGMVEPNKIQHLNTLIMGCKDEPKSRSSLPVKLNSQNTNKMVQSQNKPIQSQNNALFRSQNPKANPINSNKLSKKQKNLSFQNELLSSKTQRKNMVSNENLQKLQNNLPNLIQMVSNFSNKSDKMLFASKTSQNSQTPKSQALQQYWHEPGKYNRLSAHQSTQERDMLVNFYQAQMGRFGQYISSLLNQNALKYQGFDPYSNVKQFYQKHDNPLHEVPTQIAGQRRQHADFTEYLRKQIVIQDENNVQDQEELFFYDFDSMKEFSKYFPHNNASVVCYNYKVQMKKSRKRPQKNLLSQFKIDLLNNSQDQNKMQEIDMS